MKHHIIMLLFVSIITVSIGGCVEAILSLSDKSRFPRWITLPECKNRNDFFVKMEWHSTLTDGKIIFKLYEKGSLFAFREYDVTTDTKNNIRSLQLPSQYGDTSKIFPKYIMITINGIKDIVEQRKMEPIFYMTDDPSVWKEFGVENPNK